MLLIIHKISLFISTFSNLCFYSFLFLFSFELWLHILYLYIYICKLKIELMSKVCYLNLNFIYIYVYIYIYNVFYLLLLLYFPMNIWVKILYTFLFSFCLLFICFKQFSFAQLFLLFFFFAKWNFCFTLFNNISIKQFCSFLWLHQRRGEFCWSKFYTTPLNSENCLRIWFSAYKKPISFTASFFHCFGFFYFIFKVSVQFWF